ncbi:hypothetical protein [Burkholderia cenocepacia]|uniref:hypothetical protein n=1 Tax=Burkholderia cenocepacia TaxID=95486 RepID=UPI000A61395D|nr:hypothetical protein [Burkholderia cenocepacia]
MTHRRCRASDCFNDREQCSPFAASLPVFLVSFLQGSPKRRALFRQIEWSIALFFKVWHPDENPAK